MPDRATFSKENIEKLTGFKFSRTEFPEGMTVEMASKASDIIDAWEDTPGRSTSNYDLAVCLYLLFTSKE